MGGHLLIRHRLAPEAGGESPAGVSGDGADAGGGAGADGAEDGADGAAANEADAGAGDGDQAAGTDGQLPADHPLVRTLAAQKAEIKALKDKAAAARTGEKSVGEQLAELQARLDAEITAREQAEQAAAVEKTAALRTRLAAGRLPGPLIAKLTGTTEAEIAAEIDELAEYVVVGSHGVRPNLTPDPEQGRPRGGAAATVAAGRARFKSSRS